MRSLLIDFPSSEILTNSTVRVPVLSLSFFSRSWGLRLILLGYLSCLLASNHSSFLRVWASLYSLRLPSSTINSQLIQARSGVRYITLNIGKLGQRR